MTGPALDRFVEAQADTFERALSELRSGRKKSHWMWFVFPQIAGLGRSSTARHYAIASLDEARSFLSHSILGPRLLTASEAVLSWEGERSAVAIFGTTDAMKLRSSMTLFEQAGENPVFAQVLDAFYAGKRDAATLSILAEGPAHG